ncbi:MAG: hypothetical protein ACOCQI_04410, partial [Desulfosalsimonas sp.]
QMEEEGQDEGKKSVNLHHAAIQARQWQERIEEDYFESLEQRPDEKEKIKKKFKSQFGYIPEDNPPGQSERQKIGSDRDIPNIHGGG